jgi:rare lipoprotein A
MGGEGDKSTGRCLVKSALVAISFAIAANAPAHAQSIGQASYFQYSRYSGLFAAHRTFPVGTHVRVVNLANGRSTTVVIVGRGPFIRSRIIDVSTSAADVLGFRQAGVATVRLEVVDR